MKGKYRRLKGKSWTRFFSIDRSVIEVNELHVSHPVLALLLKKNISIG